MVFRKKDSKKVGMTMIEMLVTLSVFIVVMLAITFSLVSFYRYNAYGIEQATAIDSARRGIEPTINHIREATYSDEGSYPIVSASQNSFLFYSDIDRDNSIEKVRLFLDSGTFKKGITESIGDPPVYDGQPEEIFILSENVRNVDQGVNIFKYYDKTGAEILDTSNVSGITFVKMSVIVNVNPARNPIEFTLNASATLRNLKTNL